MLAHPAAEMDKGAGIAMCCTFGDLTDVHWWRELQLPTRAVVGRDGRVLREVPEWIAGGPGRGAVRRELAGSTTFTAREEVVAALRASGDLEGEPTPTQRMANFYEKGDKPLEIVTSRQWYIRNGGRDADLRAAMVERGREITGCPSSCGTGTRTGSSGLNGDWLISRQRFFGVPFPVWYRLDDEGQPLHDDADRGRGGALPVDPSSDPAPGSPRTSATCRAASPATRTSWTPGRPRR